MCEAPDTGQEPLHIGNEFAAVDLRAVPYGRGTRLEISAGRLGRTGLVDATVLEALTLLRESQLMQVVAMATDPEVSVICTEHLTSRPHRSRVAPHSDDQG